MAYGSLLRSAWSAIFETALEKNLVYANLANRNWEPDAQSNYIVHLNTISDPTIRNYSDAESGSQMVIDAIASTTQSLTLNQRKYSNQYIPSFVSIQSNMNVIDQVGSLLAYKLKDTIDQYMAALPSSASSGINNIITSGSGVWGAVTPSQAQTIARQERLERSGSAPYPSHSFATLIGAGATILDDNNVPADGRWVVIPNWLKEFGWQDGKYAFQPQVLSNGMVQGFSVSGFQVYSSNNIPTGFESLPVVIFGHPICWTYASQLDALYSQKSTKLVGDEIVALYIYAGLVTKNAGFAFANVRKFNG